MNPFSHPALIQILPGQFALVHLHVLTLFNAPKKPLKHALDAAQSLSPLLLSHSCPLLILQTELAWK